jgi:hypothetical protein
MQTQRRLTSQGQKDSSGSFQDIPVQTPQVTQLYEMLRNFAGLSFSVKISLFYMCLFVTGHWRLIRCLKEIQTLVRLYV